MTNLSNSNLKKLTWPILILVPVLAIITILFGQSAMGKPDIKNAELFSGAVKDIEENYVEPDRINPGKMFNGSLDQIQRVIPEILVKDRVDGSVTIVVGLAQKKFHVGALNSLSDLKKIMKEILSFTADNYHGDVPPEEIEYAAIEGMLDVLDPHSNFLSPKVYKEFMVGTRGKFGGLGIVISIKKGMLTVISPIEGTPASRAGIRPGDNILQIDDESTINMSLTDAVNKLRGNVGSKVSIVVEREGRPARKVSLTRAIINTESVQHRLLTEAGKRIGYLKLKDFPANADDNIKKAFQNFHKNGAALDGLILDLRNNPGGLLDIAIKLANHFLKEGVIVTTVGRGKTLGEEVAHAQGAENGYPIIVLVNEGSASASEIVAGALQANNRAIVMGSRSFGKGSVQTIFNLGEESALKLTIAQYKPAGTQTIQLVGVTPDIELQPVTVDRKSMDLVENEIPNEESLEQHLDNGYVEKGKNMPSSLYKIRYLKPKEDEKELEAKSVREYAKGPEIENDFAVKLAARLLKNLKGNTRETELNQASKILKEVEQEQDQVINNALKVVGIDWTALPSKQEPKLTISYHLRSGKTEISKAKAGDKIELELTATNTGSGTYSRFIAVGQSDMPFLSNREFPFGLIAPGGSKSFSTPIELPESLPKEDLSMDVTFEEANGRTPKPLTIVIPVEELLQPAFTFVYSIPSALKGKILPRGTSIPFAVDITNSGNGSTSKETTAALSNECGEKLFIEKGRATLGAILPKTSRHAVFSFHIANDFDAQKCQLKLTLADTKRFIFLTKKIDLLVKEGALKPASGEKYAAPTIEVAKLPTSTADTSIKISGTIKALNNIRDYYVFVGNKKVTYMPSATASTRMQFDVLVPLEPGPNQIAIGARDQFDLMGSKVIVVDRTSGEKKKNKFRRGGNMPVLQP